MHTDEAIHADNFRRLLEGSYAYDPNEYHGPTLSYLTRVPAWLSGARSYVEINEVTLRIVPVLFGTVLVLLLLLLIDGLGPAVIPAALLTAVSPAMVFYSRYYIHEMLLVCFTFGVLVCGYRYTRSRAIGWVIAAGVCAGLMHATKETCIVSFGAMGLALAAMTVVSVIRSRRIGPIMSGITPPPLLLGLAVAVAVSALFYSSFFHQSQGVLDSYRTYATYFGRGAGAKTMHVHPWYYYLQMLVFVRYFDGPIWTEGWIVFLALVGLVAAVRGRVGGLIDVRLARFLALYTVVMTVAYAVIPYKTPWCLLSFLHGMILLAGVGAVTLLAWARGPKARAVVVSLLVIAAGHLALLTYRANFVYYADSRNPYVYAHPTLEIFTIVNEAKAYAGVRGPGDANAVPIQVAVPGRDYWPLPWYLRAYHRVGYYTEIPKEVGPLILISDKLEQALMKRVYEDTPSGKRRMYLYLFDAPGYMWFRPGVKMLGFVRKDLWDARAEQQTDPAALMKETRGQRSPTTSNPVRGR